MDFNQLNYFRTVARLQNLSQAAKELYISQPGLSRYISRLEQEVGVPLFERRKGKVSLNVYGQVFLTNVNQAFDCLELGLETVQRLYARDQNILAIACSVEDYLTDRLREFSPRHPEIGIRQFSYSMSEIEVQLLRGNLDLAICAHMPKSDGLAYEILSQCPYVLVCHRNNPLSEHSQISLLEAAGENFICENPRLNRSQLIDHCHACGFRPNISHEVESGYILHDLLETNSGVALVPYAHFMKINAQNPGHQLCAVALKDALPTAEIGVAFYPNRTLSASASVFIEFLHKCAVEEADEMNRQGIERQ